MKIKCKMMTLHMALNGITLNALVGLTGVSKATLSAVKNGKSCSYETATKIAKALDLDLMKLIESEE